MPRDYFGANIPFTDFCDIEPLSSEPGHTQLAVTLGPHHLNQMGVAHGGVVLTLMDVTMGTAARSMTGTAGVVTVDLQSQFLAPAKGRLKSDGRVVKAGRSMVFVEATVINEAGELVAKGSGVFKAHRPPQA